MKAYTGGNRLTDFRGFKEASNKYYSSRYPNLDNDNFKYFRISREKAGITTGTITHNATPDSGGDGNGTYIIGGSQGDTLTATTAVPLDSYQLFLDEKSLDSNPRRLIGQVTFDGVIQAVIHSKDSGAETVGTMNFDAGGTYAGSLQGGRAFEKKGNTDIKITSTYRDNHWLSL